MSKKYAIFVWLGSLAALVSVAGLAFVSASSRRVGRSPGIASSRKIARNTDLQKTYPAFTVTSSRTVTLKSGETHRVSLVQQMQRSDGVYKLVQTFFARDGSVHRVQSYFGFIGLGVFRLDETRKLLVFTGPQIEDPSTDIEQFLRTDSLFTREDSVVGIKTIVWQRQGQYKTSDFIEEYRAPSLGGLLIKTITVSGDEKEVFEPTAIEIGEPPASLFVELSYPSDYSFYAGVVKEAEKDKEPQASFMRRFLERMQLVRPW